MFIASTLVYSSQLRDFIQFEFFEFVNWHSFAVMRRFSVDLGHVGLGIIIGDHGFILCFSLSRKTENPVISCSESEDTAGRQEI